MHLITTRLIERSPRFYLHGTNITITPQLRHAHYALLLSIGRLFERDFDGTAFTAFVPTFRQKEATKWNSRTVESGCCWRITCSGEALRIYCGGMEQGYFGRRLLRTKIDVSVTALRSIIHPEGIQLGVPQMKAEADGCPLQFADSFVALPSDLRLEVIATH